MSFDATKAKVIKFNGKNYTQWRAEMIAAFCFLPGLHNIIIGAATYDDDFHQDSSGTIILDSDGKGTHIATQTKLVVGTPIRAIRPKLLYHFDRFVSHESQGRLTNQKSVVVTGHDQFYQKTQTSH